MHRARKEQLAHRARKDQLDPLVLRARQVLRDQQGHRAHRAVPVLKEPKVSQVPKVP